jgi:hypothetical protein
MQATSDTAHSETSAPATAASGKAQDEGRSTTFQAVEGGAETRSGSTLMVEAYVVLWLILLTWIVLLWRKQSGLNARLDDLERAIDKAAKAPRK